MKRGTCRCVAEFPPGSFLDSREGQIKRYYRPSWREYSQVRGKAADPDQLREALKSAVDRQLMTDVPYGVLLSGGLDSSVIAALASQLAARRVETAGKEAAWWPRLHSFAIGLEGSPDLKAAKVAADHLDTVHHGFEYTVQHYAQQSALVMLLHSILGTGTNTFAMKADKIPALRELM